ncbi:mechanosensitive ion channel family protein [Desulfurobacterium indicum]|uniref:Mechanosensitive ion channel protein MscS n=1 Tax=Desulfurobacterium indicum TaxID=1914305 RepID=A0A1R1MKX7_9BACT|nr:mechanosensitive ion channel domain-containing protein [Desulfurobacterium indicum]OMH40360.1 mechanosensitive ion channel protein MscS [Desulfurobacterium indicum]
MKINYESYLKYLPGIFLIFCSFVVLKVKAPINRVLKKIFLKDRKISKAERLILELSSILNYILSVFFLHFGLLQFNLSPIWKNAVNIGAYTLYIGFATLAVLKIIDIFIEFLSERTKKTVPVSEIPLVETYFSMISKIVKIFVVFVSSIILLDKLGFNVTSLITSLGVGSLAVGLAAQDTIKNFISGILLVTDRQFRIGDRVYIKDIDVDGYVYDIGLRTTRIITISGNNLIIVPNSKLTEGVIENALYPDMKFKDSVKIGVEYGSDIELVKKLLLEAITTTDGVLKEPPPSVFFIDFGDSALIFQAFYYVKKKDIAYGVKSKINEKINKLFAENGINIPFPCQTNYFPEGVKIKIDKE